MGSTIKSFIEQLSWSLFLPNLKKDIHETIKYYKFIQAFEWSLGREELYVHSVFAKLHHSFMPNA